MKDNCTYANESVPGTYSHAMQVVTNSQVATADHATGQGHVVVCYAAEDTLGDEAGDFSQLTTVFSQLGFSPIRAVQGSLQLLELVGGQPGDQLGHS